MRRKLAAICALAAAGMLAGCRQDMQDQPKFIPQRGTDFYADGRSARPQVENTVARGQLHQDAYFYTGLGADGKEGNTMPFAVTMDVLQRGQERYNIYCTPCHSRVGNGAGMIVQRGYRPAGNFHTPRLMAMPLGHFFNVMTNGYGAMPDYKAQVSPADRWAIVAYIKALQLSQDAKPADAAPGAQIESLSNIAASEGLPANFGSEWVLPKTAIYGTPNNEDNGIPPALPPGANGKYPAAQPTREQRRISNQIRTFSSRPKRMSSAHEQHGAQRTRTPRTAGVAGRA